MELLRELYGTTPDGAKIDSFTLKNSGGVSAAVITYGCILTCLRMPDKTGKIGEITLGFDKRVWKAQEPAVQLYAGNFLTGIRGAGGATFSKHAALCLETEVFPDAVNQPEFPSAVLRPGETYHHITVQRFFTE